VDQLWLKGEDWNWETIFYGQFRSLLFKFWTLCVLSPLWGGGLGTTYDVYLKLIGKREVDFLLVLIFFRYVLRLRRYW